MVAVGGKALVRRYGERPTLRCGSPLAVLDETNLLANYNFQQGANADTVYDLTGSYNATRGSGGSYKPTWTSSGLLFDASPQLVAFPTALASQIRTDYWCCSLQAKPSFLRELIFPWYQMSDGCLNMEGESIGGQPGAETYCSGEKLAGNVIFASSYGTGATMAYGTSTGAYQEIASYKGRSTSVLPDKSTTYDIYWLGYYAGRQYAGNWYYRLCYSVAHNAEQMANQIKYIHQTLDARGVTLGNTLTDCPQIAGIGDSLTGSPIYNASVTEYGNWLYQLDKSLTDTVRCTNYGLSGYRARDLPSIISARSTILSRTTATPKVAVIWAGINDLLGDSASASTIIGYLTDCVTAARNAGWTKVVVVTPSGGDWATGGYTAATVKTALATIYSAIAAKTTGHDETADISSTPVGHTTDGGTSNWIDFLHLADTGHAYVAAAVEIALNALGIT